jgi:hypothetical protein
VTNTGTENFGYASLPVERFETARDELKYAYLAGAYYRYGGENCYRFANSSDKVKLIARLIEEVDCDSVRTTSRASIPCDNRVYFRETEELRNWFERYPGRWAMDRADTLMGPASPDEAQVYSAVLDAAEAGAFDGCELKTPYFAPRTTFVMERPSIVLDDVPPRFAEALSDLERRNYEGDAVSLCYLADRAVLYQRTIDFGMRCRVNLNPVGFSAKGNAAATLVVTTCPSDGGCSQTVVVFLKKRDMVWNVSHYAVKEPRRPSVKWLPSNLQMLR